MLDLLSVHLIRNVNGSAIITWVTEGVSILLETLNSIPAAAELLSAAQKATSEKQETVTDTQTQIWLQLQMFQLRLSRVLSRVLNSSRRYKRISSTNLVNLLHPPMPIQTFSSSAMLLSHWRGKGGGPRQTALRLLAPNPARAVRPKIRLWSHTRKCLSESGPERLKCDGSDLDSLHHSNSLTANLDLGTHVKH